MEITISIIVALLSIRKILEEGEILLLFPV